MQPRRDGARARRTPSRVAGLIDIYSTAQRYACALSGHNQAGIAAKSGRSRKCFDPDGSRYGFL